MFQANVFASLSLMAHQNVFNWPFSFYFQLTYVFCDYCPIKKNLDQIELEFSKGSNPSWHSDPDAARQNNKKKRLRGIYFYQKFINFFPPLSDFLFILQMSFWSQFCKRLNASRCTERQIEKTAKNSKNT